MTYFCDEDSDPIKVVLGGGNANTNIGYFQFESLTVNGLEIDNTGGYVGMPPPFPPIDPNLPIGHQTEWLTVDGDDYEPTILTYNFILRPKRFLTSADVEYTLFADVIDESQTAIVTDTELGSIDAMFLVSGNISDGITGLPSQAAGSINFNYLHAIVVDQELVVDVPGNYYMKKQSSQGERILKLNAGARIVVENGSRLIIDGFIINGCDEMWENILVKQGGSLTLRNCFVLDGERAVHVKEGGTVTLNETRFVNNWAALDIRNNPPIQGNSATASIRRCTFEGIGTMKAPRENEIPWAGILAVDLPSLSLPHQQGNSVFSNMHNGIRVYNTTLLVDRATFTDISQRANGSGGDAIYSAGITSSLTVRGYGIGSDSPNFTNCFRGINSNRNNLTVYDNIMEDVTFGIRVDQSSFMAQEIRDNKINANNIGIHLLNVMPAFGRIQNNIIKMDNPFSPTTSYAIKGDLAPANSLLSNWYIENNAVRLENSQHGIFIQSGRNVGIDNNVVNAMGSILVEGYEGIGLRGAQWSRLQCNSVVGDVVGNNYYDATGIYVSTANAANVTCNTVDKTNLGIELFGMSTLFNLRGNTYKKHKTGLLIKENASIGDQFFNTSYYGNQWNSLNFLDDQNMDDKFGAENENIDDSQSRFIVRTGNSNALRRFMPSLSPNDDEWFFPAQGTNYTCNFNPCGFILNGVIANDDDKLLKNIINNELVDDNFNASLRYTGARQLFRNMSSGEFQPNESTFSSFLNSESSTTVGAFYTLENSMANLFHVSESQQESIGEYSRSINEAVDEIWLKDALIESSTDPQEIANLESEKAILMNDLVTAQQNHQLLYDQLNATKAAAIPQVITDNQSIATIEPYEDYDQTVNDIFLNTIAVDQELDDNQRSILIEIANQCPLLGGEAVYHARAMIQGGNYDDDKLCAVAAEKEMIGKKEEINSSDFAITPNPSDGQFSLILPSGVKAISISNTMGQVVREYNNSTFTNRWQLPDATLPAGLYYCTVETITSKTTKPFVVIIK